MSKLKNKKYITLIGILVLVIGILGLFVLGRTDKYKGLVKVKNVASDTTVLSAAISNTIEQPNTSRGSDEIKYEISYTLDRITGVDKRDAVIKASLSDAEGKYARFKKINGTNITSTVKNDGKEIEVEVRDVPLGIENRITLKLVITNAPNGFKVRPDITIKEKTSDEETPVTTSEIEVSTESITGLVKDENGTLLNNIELSLNKNGEIKRTYTDEDGRYIFSDIENGRYTVEVEEEIYELVGNNVIENSGTLNLIVKEVTPYEIEAHKYITNLDLVINGKSESYTYDDLETVVQAVKNAKTVSGKITYKISIKNIGEKTGKLSMLKDIVDKGLSFDSNKNKGWKEKDGNLYYEPIANVSINKGETRDIGLVLDINSTKEIKTYINEITVNGETYEKVVYILNGVKYREENVILGEKIEELIIQDESFDGWYTDKNYTNKYNFNNEVTKDLILYGRTEVKKYNVEFYDKDPDSGVETLWDTQEVTEGDKAVEPEEPTKTGYTFECWMDEHDNIWNFNNPVERNLKLVSCYTLNQYSIVYKGLTDAEKTALNNPTTYTIRDTVTINNAHDRYDEDELLSERFIGWTGSNGDTPSTNISFSHETGDKEYTANFEHVDPDEYLITYVLNGGELEEGKTNPSSYTKKTPTFTLNNPSKEHYRFIGWTGSNGDVPQTTVTLEKGQNEGDKQYVANYEIITHNVSFKDKDPENPVISTITDFGDPVTVNDGEKVTPPGSNPTHTGYTCDRWSTKLDGDYNDDAYDFNTAITSDLVLYTLCKKNSYTVTFMDGENQFARQNVLYKDKATIPSPDPTKAHNIFLGWTLNNSLYNFNTEVTQDITLYSSYEYVEEASVSHTPTEWTNQNVIVTITNKGTEGKDYTGYTYKYRVNNGQYTTYNGPFEIEENCDIYVIATKNNVDSIEVKHEITNIDKIKPLVDDLSLVSKSSSEITVSMTGHDNESGMKEFKLYLDDQYVTSIIQTGDPNESKTSEYTFSSLEGNTTYGIKVVSVDIATNESAAEEIEVQTSKEKIIVAQIITSNGVPLNEEDYVMLESIREGLEYVDAEKGINCVVNQCTIQMLASVRETNDVLQGQDITLDLNGKTVTDLNEYTFTNYGHFTLIDTAETPGKIASDYIGIVNTENGVFTMGVNDIELNVSVTAPYIEGNYIGVKNEGTFNFYDGKIKGITAINGRVNDNPFMYQADVQTVTEDEVSVQIATLKQLEDAEARIQNVYYSKIKNAVEDAKEGHYEDIITDTAIGDNMIQTGQYGFDFDSETNTYVSNNNVENREAIATIDLDMKEYSTDQLLTLSGLVTSSNISYTYEGIDYYSESVYFSVYDLDVSTSSSMQNFTFSGNIRSSLGGTEKYILKPQGRYRIKLYFKTINESDEGTDTDSKFTISEISLQDYVMSDDSIPGMSQIQNVYSNYSFDYDSETDTIRSNNNYAPYTVAFSSMAVDLTAENQDQLLIINASLDTYGNNDYGIVRVKEDNNFESSSSSSNSMIYMSGYTYDAPCYVGPQNYYKTLEAGKKYYVQFYYYKSGLYKDGKYVNTKEEYEALGSNDEFIINSIDIVPSVDYKITSNDVHTDGQYGLEYYSYSDYYRMTSGPIDSVSDSYINVDLTNSNIPKYMTLEMDASFTSGSILAVYVTNSASTPAETETDYLGLNGDNYLGRSTITVPLQNNQNNYVHIVYREKNSGSYNYTYLYSAYVKSGKQYDLKKNFKSNFTYNSSSGYYYANGSSMNELKEGYISIDLSQETYNQVLNIEAKLNGLSNRTYFYISNSKSKISYENLKGTDKLLFATGKYAGYMINGNTYYSSKYTYKFPLEAGKRYYLHIAELFDYDTYNKLELYNIYTTPITNSIYDGEREVVPEESDVEPEPTADGDTFTIDDGTVDKNFRYFGNNANNYISFNDETWRIIGSFKTVDENAKEAYRLKIVRESSIGYYPYNTTPNGYEYDSSTGGGGTEITVNGGMGLNDWATSDLMKLLNPGYENNQDYVLYGSSSNLYVKDTVSNSLYWTRSNGTCYNGTNNVTASCYFSSNGMKDNYKQYIDKVVWNTGSVNDQSGSALDIYNQEHGTGVGNTSPDGVTRSTTWTGYVGLMNVSDIMYSTDESTYSGTYYSRSQCLGSMGVSSYCLYTNSWLKNITYGQFWTLDVTNQIPNYGVIFNPYPGFGNYPAGLSAYIRPTVYLSPKVVISSGSGTSDDPYKISMGTTDNPSKYYGLHLVDGGEDEGDVPPVDYNSLDNETYYELFNNRTIYGFEYDSAHNSYNNTNSSIPSSLASSMISIDTTGYEEDVEMVISADVDFSSSYQSGYIYIYDYQKDIIGYDNTSAMSSDNNPYSLFFNQYSTYNNPVNAFKLEKNKTYYIYIANVNSSTDSSEHNTFNVKLSLPEDAEKKYNFDRYDGIAPIINQDADTVQMLKNITLTETLSVNEIKNMILDLNGYTLDISSDKNVIENEGILTIVDSAYERAVEAASGTEPDIEDYGKVVNSSTGYTNPNTILNKEGATLDVEGGSIVISSSGNSSHYKNAINNNGTLKVGANAIVKATGSYNNAIYNNGTILEGSGLIKVTNEYDNGIYNNVDTTIKGYRINTERVNATYSSRENKGIYVPTGKTVTYNNITISGTGIGVYNDQGTITLNSSTMTSGDSYYTIFNHGTLNTNLCTINSELIGIYNDSGNVSITDTDINITANTANAKAINNNSGSNNNPNNVSITGGSVTVTSQNGTNVKEAITNSERDTMTITGDFEMSGDLEVGINNKSTLTIGTKDSVGNEKPIIDSKTYAIKSLDDTVFNFYDGELIGLVDNTLYGQVDDIETNHDLKSTIVGDYDHITLRPLEGDVSEDDYVARIGSTKYTSIQKAVDASSANDEIVILKDIITAQKVTIPNTKTATINFDNHNFTSYSEDTAFENNGNITITGVSGNTDNTNVFKSFDKIAFITNNSTLSVEKLKMTSELGNLLIKNNATGTASVSSSELSSEKYTLIDNFGTISLTDDDIRSTTEDLFLSESSHPLIKNEENATMTTTYLNLYHVGSSAFFLNSGDLNTNYNNVESDGYLYKYSSSRNYKYTTTYIENASTGVVNSTGDELAIDYEGRYGRIIKNEGTATFEDLVSNFHAFGTNSGVLTLRDSIVRGVGYTYYSDNYTGNLVNTGKLTIDGGSYSFNMNNSIRSYKPEDVSDSDYSVDILNAELSGKSISLEKGNLDTVDMDSVIVTMSGDNCKITDSTIVGASSNLTYIDLNSGSLKYINSTMTVKSNYAIKAAGTSTVEVVSGTITNNSGATDSTAIKMTGTSTLILGTKDYTAVRNPKVTSTLTGITGSSTTGLKFYDGEVKGRTALSIPVADQEVGYVIVSEPDGNDEINYLGKVNSFRNKRTGGYYGSLELAIDEADSGDTIELLRNITGLSTAEPVVVDRFIELDLNGFTYTHSAASNFITNNSNLTISDESGSIGGLYTVAGPLIVNNGDLAIMKGTYDTTSGLLLNNNNNATISNGAFVGHGNRTLINNNGDLNISGGTLQADITSCSTSSNVHLITTTANSVIQVSGGTFTKHNSGGSVIDNNGSVEITAGTFNVGGCTTSSGAWSKTYAVKNEANASLIITGGTYPTHAYSELVENSGTADISGISLDYYLFAHNEGTLNVNQVTMNKANSVLTPQNAVANTGEVFKNTGTATITSSTFEKFNSSSRVGIKLSDNSTTTFNSVGIENAVISSSDSTVNILNNTEIDSYTNNYFSVTKSTVVIGENDSTVSTTYPRITSNDRAIVIDKHSNVSFYDGKFVGTTPISGGINAVPTNYDIVKGTDGGYNSKYLATDDLIENTNTGVTYKSFDDAITNASNGNTLRVLREYTSLKSSNTITIPTGKTLTIDLNGNMLYGNMDTFFENNGTLTINDSSETINTNVDTTTTYNRSYSGGIVSTIGSNVVNNGTLTINGGHYDKLGSYYDYDISTAVSGKYTNSGTGTLVINNAIFDSTIYNYGDINIKNGRYYSIPLYNYKTAVIDNGYVPSSSNTTNAIILNYDDSALLTINDIYIVGGVTNQASSPVNDSYISQGVVNILGGTYNPNVTSNYTFSNFGEMNFSGGNYASSITKLVRNYNTTNISGITGNGVISYEGTMSLTNSNIGDITTTDTTLTVDGGTYGDISSTTSDITVDSGTINKITLSNSSLEFNDGTVNAGISGTASGLREVKILGGTINNSTGIGVNITSGLLTIGEKDGIVSTTTPSITGQTVGVNANNFNFYDGIISGEYAVTGGIGDVEVDYRVVSSTNAGVVSAYLRPIAEAPRYAEVNNINYNSLQEAVNACSDSSTSDIIIYTNIMLDEVITVPSTKNINIYLNGYTITPEEYVTNHSGTGTVNIVSGAPTGAGGAIYRFLASLTGKQINPRDIIIYQMEDGTELSADVTYKLYRLLDSTYKLVKVNEIEVGVYELDRDSTNINTVNGKVRINQIGEGTYKLVGSDGKELEFEIGENSVSNNIIVDRFSAKANVTASAIATLILQLQTGILRTPYILIILILFILIIGGYILIQKKKKDYE